MQYKSCVVYSITKNSMGCAKLNSYYGDDLQSRDSSLCAAFTNTDKNHFYFSYPELVPNKSHYTHACLWCAKLCEEVFCGAQCESTFDLNIALEFAENNAYSKITTQHRFTLFD